MKKKVLFLGICLFLVSCIEKSKKEIEVIKVDIDNVEKSSLFSIYNYIVLETTNDALLENIVKVKIVEKDIFLLSSYGGSIYHFTKEGKFVRKWPRGNGPGELISPTDFFVNQHNKTITILDLYRTLKTYSYDGEILNERKIDNPYFLFDIYDNDTLLFDSNLSQKNNYQLSVFNSNGEFSFLPKKENLKRVAFMPANVFVEKDSATILISYMLSDTIYDYSIANQRINPLFHVDINRPSLNNLSNINFQNARDFQKKTVEKGYISGITGMSCWNDELFFIIYFQEKFYYAMYDMKKKNIQLYEQLSNELPNAKYYVNRDRKSLTCMYTMAELKNASIKNEELKKIVMNAAEDDNPILIIFEK